MKGVTVREALSVCQTTKIMNSSISSKTTVFKQSNHNFVRHGHNSTVILL